MNANRFKEISCVIEDNNDTHHIYTKYILENFETMKNGIPMIITNKLKIVYESRNGNENATLYKWSPDNGWILFANMHSCNDVYVESYVCSKQKHLEAFEKSCDGFLKLWEKFIQTKQA